MLFAGSKLFPRSLRLACGSVPLMLITGVLPPLAGAQQPRSASPTPTQISAQPATQATSQLGTTAASAPTAAEQAHALKVQELINRAQASYTAGVNDYNSDHLDAARAAFDAAVDTMLLSGMDINKDPQLSDAFEDLLESITSH